MQYPHLSDSPSSLDQLAITMTQAIERKDRYTAGHVKRTAYYATKIARELPGMTEERIERVRLAADPAIAQ